MKRLPALTLLAIVVVSGCLGYGGATTSDSGGTSGGETEVQSGEVTVTYTSGGFQPSTVKVTKGTTVTWVSDGPSMWVASDVHPTHEQYDGTSRTAHCGNPTDTTFDQCGSGQEFSFTFSKVGTWNYHNHVSPGRTGTVVVVEG